MLSHRVTQQWQIALEREVERVLPQRYILNELTTWETAYEDFTLPLQRHDRWEVKRGESSS